MKVVRPGVTRVREELEALAGTPVVQVIDRRDDDPREGLLSSALTPVLRSDHRVLCVLNRLGRSKLLACVACGELARCERCDAAVEQPDADLHCRRCGAHRPVLCLHCGATRFKNVRAGVTRVREELEALVGEPVSELTASSGRDAPAERVVIGTEAVLQRIDRADVVVLLDLDQELLAPRYRAAEQALTLVARAARVVASATPRVGGRAGGRLVLQTRTPHHEVVQAAVHADPSLVAEAEANRRRLLQLPPTTALAEISGPAAPAYLDALGHPPGVQVAEVADGRWLLRAPDHATLCDALAATRRPAGRVRVAVDPLRV
jgi:primosomal protein N' (replication factor Y)